MRRPGDVLMRMDDKYLIGSGCWPWLAATTNGYGVAWDGDRQVPAHRLMYELLVGPIPAGLELDHLCRNHGCVRPDHLEPVSHAENVRRGESGAHQRRKTHCPQGHEYTEENTYQYRGWRVCRQCRLARVAAAYRRKRTAI
jgi:hypothetical protein